jgi:hypothetical protein
MRKDVLKDRRRDKEREINKTSREIKVRKIGLKNDGNK